MTRAPPQSHLRPLRHGSPGSMAEGRVPNADPGNAPAMACVMNSDERRSARYWLRARTRPGR